MQRRLIHWRSQKKKRGKKAVREGLTNAMSRRMREAR